MKVEPFLLASTINVIIAQRLVRRLYSSKEKYFLAKNQLDNLKRYVDTDKVLEILKKEKIIKTGDDWNKIPFYKPKESKECVDGYKDRVGIHEILKVNETIKNLVMSNATSDDIEKQAKKEGMITMLEDGIIKCVQGITTIEEILRVTRE